MLQQITGFIYDYVSSVTRPAEKLAPSSDAPLVFYQKSFFMSLQLACAKIVTHSHIEMAGLLHPIDDLASNCRIQIKYIPPRRQRQFRYVAYDLSAGRENITRTP